MMESILSAHSLTIGYQTGSNVGVIADDLELGLQAGEFVCLLGPNGAGKSTLIRSLSGMQDPVRGSIRLSGNDLSDISPRERARLISVVLTENTAVGMMDAYAMVSLGRHPYSGWFGNLDQCDRERIDRALQSVGATDLASRQVAELSDGERQKISIARALAQETKVMLLDEPTAFLDLPRRVELMSILRNLAHKEQLALLLSTHDLDLALRFADRLWVLTPEGKLIQGYPEAIALSREFAKVFESEKLDWDPAIGSFRAHPSPCLHVSVEGDGVAALWTKRAMERMGFGLATEPSTDVALTISIRDESWEITRGETSENFNDIGSMIEWVLKEDWS